MTRAPRTPPVSLIQTPPAAAAAAAQVQQGNQFVFVESECFNLTHTHGRGSSAVHH